MRRGSHKELQSSLYHSAAASAMLMMKTDPRPSKFAFKLQVDNCECDVQQVHLRPSSTLSRIIPSLGCSVRACLVPLSSLVEGRRPLLVDSARAVNATTLANVAMRFINPAKPPPPVIGQPVMRQVKVDASPPPVQRPAATKPPPVPPKRPSIRKAKSKLSDASSKDAPPSYASASIKEPSRNQIIAVLNSMQQTPSNAIIAAIQREPYDPLQCVRSSDPAARPLLTGGAATSADRYGTRHIPFATTCASLPRRQRHRPTSSQIPLLHRARPLWHLPRLSDPPLATPATDRHKAKREIDGTIGVEDDARLCPRSTFAHRPRYAKR